MRVNTCLVVRVKCRLTFEPNPNAGLDKVLKKKLSRWCLKDISIHQSA